VKAAVKRRRDSSSEAPKQEVMQLYENEEGFMVLTSAVGAVRAVRAVRATLFMFLRAVLVKVGGVTRSRREDQRSEDRDRGLGQVRPKSRELPIWRAHIYGQSSPPPMNHEPLHAWDLAVGPWDVEPCMCETSLTCSGSLLARKQLLPASK
jgi:hypothetical protein